MHQRRGMFIKNDEFCRKTETALSLCLNVWQCKEGGAVVYCPCKPLGEGTCRSTNEKWTLGADGELQSAIAAAEPASNGVQVWRRPLASGAIAVALLNRGELAANISFSFKDVGLDSSSAWVSDVWAGGQPVRATAQFGRLV